jgi:hypothetical protein
MEEVEARGYWGGVRGRDVGELVDERLGASFV